MNPHYMDHETNSIIDIDPYGIDGKPWHWVPRVSVPERHRGSGAGSRLMRRVVDAADAEGVALALFVVPTGRVDIDPGRDELIAWYERLGFKQIRSDGICMVREPQPSPVYQPTEE